MPKNRDRNRQTHRKENAVDKEGGEDIHAQMLTADIPNGKPEEKEGHDVDSLFVVHGVLL